MTAVIPGRDCNERARNPGVYWHEIPGSRLCAPRTDNL